MNNLATANTVRKVAFREKIEYIQDTLKDWQEEGIWDSTLDDCELTHYFSPIIEEFGCAVYGRQMFIPKDTLIVGKIHKHSHLNVILKISLSNYPINRSYNIAPFDGVIGKRNFSDDIEVSESSLVINLEDASSLFVDVDVPEVFATFINEGLNVEIKFSGNKEKSFKGIVESLASRIDTNKRSLAARIKLNNSSLEILPGALLEVTIKYDERNSLGIPDTSVILEGNKVYIYKVDEKNITNRTEIEIGSRSQGFLEVKSGLNKGDIIVAEGLKKVRPNGKIKPIKDGVKKNNSEWKKKTNSTKSDSKKSKFDWLKKLNIFNKSESKKKDEKNK